MPLSTQPSRHISDITLRVEDRTIHAHRLVLAARGQWTEGSLATATDLSLAGMTYRVAWTVVRWLYTDRVEQVRGRVFGGGGPAKQQFMSRQV